MTVDREVFWGCFNSSIFTKSFQIPTQVTVDKGSGLSRPSTMAKIIGLIFYFCGSEFLQG